MQRPSSTSSHSAQRLGLTALEVIITTLVLLMLAALLLPAMQSTCGGSRRSSCRNNLKQIGLALHNYHEVHQAFPPGWIANRSDEATHPVEGFGWLAPALSKFEMQGLTDELDFYSPLVSHRNTRAASKAFDALRCPSEMAEATAAFSLIPEMGLSSYVGSFGVGVPAAIQDPEVCQGVFGSNSQTRIRDIKDGTTNVVMVGERRFVRNGTDWPIGSVQGPFNSYWAGIPDLETVSPLCVVGTLTTGDPTANGADDVLNRDGPLNAITSPDQFVTVKPLLINRTLGGTVLSATADGKSPEAVGVTGGFSSWHTGGSQFLLCDGSVRFISEKIDPNTLINLSRRSDGQALGQF
ncbi:DUF1559 domain-containing protein [bacterium]|nr:DUF1559 domain-containing protein [bacterium]